MKRDRGVIFFNAGLSCLARIAVAAHSLRKHYAGPATLIHVGDDGRDEARKIAGASSRIDFLPAEWRATEGHARALLNKCCLHLDTPYELSLLLDADTVTRADPTPIMDAATIKGFAVAQFSDWKTRGRIRVRIEEWRPIVGDAWTEEALDFGPAINTGVYAFRRDSDLMRDWYGLAVKNRAGFIPDEACCQVMLPRYPANVLTANHNVSCRYGTPRAPDTLVIHFHGRKNARIANGTCLNNCDLWYREFEEIRHRPDVQAVIPHERLLRKNLPAWDKIK